MHHTFDQVIFSNLRQLMALCLETNPKPIIEESKRIPADRFKYFIRDARRNNRKKG